MTTFVIEGYDNLRIIHAPTGMIHNHYNPLPPKCLLLFSVKFMKGIIRHRATFIFCPEKFS